MKNRLYMENRHMDYHSLLEKCIRKILPEGNYFICNTFSKVLPIRHDILRDEYWIFNEIIEGKYKEHWNFRFTKVQILPTLEEQESIEWNVVNLINHFHYSHTGKEDLFSDIYKFIKNKEVNVETFYNMVEKYGTDATKNNIKVIRTIFYS
jgi:hypothetical protein